MGARRIKVVANPAAGKDEPFLGTLNEVFGEGRVTWDISVTNGPGEATDLAREAVRDGWDCIAAYGGDGHVMEVAVGLLDTQTPLGLLPGGTGNVMAMELGVPADLAEAARLLVSSEPSVRGVDVGRTRDCHFLLRLGLGFEAAMKDKTSRPLKQSLGPFAYLLSSLQVLSDPPLAEYRLTVDGERYSCSGLLCVVANSGMTGIAGISLAENIRVDDGKLDVIVLEAEGVAGLLGAAGELAAGTTGERIHRWSGTSIRIEAEPAQDVTCDGEDAGQSPVDVDLLPGALRVIVPESES